MLYDAIACCLFDLYQNSYCNPQAENWGKWGVEKLAGNILIDFFTLLTVRNVKLFKKQYQD